MDRKSRSSLATYAAKALRWRIATRLPFEVPYKEHNTLSSNYCALFVSALE